MSRAMPSLECLNAYVDGELPGREASAVAALVAENREVAETVAALSRLKAAVQEGFAPQPAELPAPPPRPASRLPAIAACLAFLAFLAGTAIAHIASLPGKPDWVAQAWALHDAWQGQVPGDGEPDRPGDFLTAVSGFTAEVTIPNLTAARLRLVRFAAADGPPGTQTLHLGYEGSRGCRVSLFLISPYRRLPPALTDFGDGTALAYGWRIGGAGHLLLARGMDPERFRLIAESVHRATLEAAPFDAETRTALARSREESQPCLS